MFLMICQVQSSINDRHHSDVIMTAMTSQVTGVSIVCGAFRSSADERKLQSSASLVFLGKSTSGFPSKRTSNTKNVSIRWHPHVYGLTRQTPVKWYSLVLQVAVTNTTYVVWQLRNSSVLIGWWRHKMETFPALLVICAGNSPVTGEFPAQRPVTRSFDVFFDLRLNRRLSKQWWAWQFETLSRPLWCHRNGNDWGLMRVVGWAEIYYLFEEYLTIHVKLRTRNLNYGTTGYKQCQNKCI